MYFQFCIGFDRIIMYVSSRLQVSPLAVKVGRLLRKRINEINSEGEIIELFAWKSYDLKILVLFFGTGVITTVLIHLWLDEAIVSSSFPKIQQKMKNSLKTKLFVVKGQVLKTYKRKTTIRNVYESFLTEKWLYVYNIQMTCTFLYV